MKTVRSAFMLFITALVFSACANNKKEATQTGDTAKKEPVAAAQKPATLQLAKESSIKDDRLNAVYGQYQQLTTALIEGDAAVAAIASNALEAGARYMQNGKTLAALASKITTASGIEAKRVQYASLSNEMIRLVKQTGVENGAVYVDFCPMAFDNKGAHWLSNSAEIKNPYFGAGDMLTCGEAKETIKE